jgi:serine/threonine-protein kinase
MAALDRFVLPSDVAIVPVAELAPQLRREIDHVDGDYSVTRPRSRTMSSIVDARTAALLETFREPSTIVDAVIAFSAAEGGDPRATLDDAVAVLGDFVDGGLLVAADSELAHPIDTSLAPGDLVGGFELIEPAHVIVDTEVYRARTPDGAAAALKIARPAAGPHTRAAFAHEATVLDHLDGRVNPRLLELGELEGRPYLATTWFAGVDVHHAATEARELGGGAGFRAVTKLAERVIDAYAHLHARGVLHGDVYPRNVLVDARGAVTIIDYGLAAIPAATAMEPRGRGGTDFFLEPELAAASLAGRPPPALTGAAEQYSIAALVYLMLTGAHTHAFSLDEEEMQHQLLEQPPLPFERHGVRGMPSLERTITRALAKEPSARFRSVRHLLRSFRAAAARDAQKRRNGRPPSRPQRHRELLDDVLGRIQAPRELPAPTAPAFNGATGVACALLRIAEARGDAALLASADVWSTRALLAAGSDDAFWNAERQIVPETIGTNSLFHHAGGVHLVHAQIAQARGDAPAQRLALESFIGAAAEPCERLDVTFGAAGLLLGCCMALETQPDDASHQRLRALGDGLRDSLWARLEREPALADGTQLRSLGVAHGWAGYLFALLRWSDAAGAPAPAGVEQRLAQLADFGEPAGRGIMWPLETTAPVPDSALAASWCNGAAGQVHLWTLAHAHFGDERYARLAQMAAWAAAEDDSPAAGDLCCGLAGRAYALLALDAHGGEHAWLARAERLADRAAAGVRRESKRRDGLYQGEVGVALLAADLDAPDDARMPLFAASRAHRQRGFS